MYTAEFVSKRHPDKMCDQISDAILDHCLKLDPLARVAVEVMGGHGAVVIMGEITVSDKKLLKDFDAKAEEIVARITGHTPGFLELTCNIVPQSADIKKGVDKNNGAGDQGIMRGYAVRDTPELMPLEYILARNLCDEIFKEYPYDGKTQITIDEEKHVTAIVASFQYASSVTLEDIVKQWIITNNVKAIGRPEASMPTPDSLAESSWWTTMGPGMQSGEGASPARTQPR
jgi:S-adenosylmethionine synthetase